MQGSRGAINKISKKYSPRAYVQVYWKGRHYEYTSHDETRWPRTRDDLEIIYPLITQWTPATFVKRPPLSSNLKATPASLGKPLESAGEQPMEPKLAKDRWTARD
ncbi:uncharacterized protein B0I36DRAFT_342707 [Microdochium trichocladiopsis]|uniref:Uncharacterized protein n=1 Tax=Microdochium trichocladiopsis TaxID=1682393 RepID=A0A9P8XPN6_9PEZI|nr:uncharacterized protein B0I36DRAFT_342707 [Microdochium trichocladiopsis]KAH7009261.1 hypothetical protein B0I36DRAFT_342707 [Microdochium trichocladiopsis]